MLKGSQTRDQTFFGFGALPLRRRASIAVVATVPQLISEGAVRKVVEMASEYWLPLSGFVENQQNGVTGEAGHHLASDYGLPLLVQIPCPTRYPCR